MQFAGQRTDLSLKPLCEPINALIRMTDDILPEPDAILVTGITPQLTRAEGITEAEFLKIFSEQVATPGTIFVGFNTVRFDDEFMRFLHYRNFYDPYEWQWQDGRSRWDMLDVVRMTRALRPDGIEWPVDAKGNATNRLELLTDVNGLDHADAHDALSDVKATIAVARLIRNKHQKLFDYLLTMRKKEKIAELVDAGQPFVYTSGKYASEYQKTTVVAKIANHPERKAALVYDLRYDPAEFLDKSPTELVELWKYKKDRQDIPLPIKTLQYNRCPAIAPLGVLDDASKERIGITLTDTSKNLRLIQEHPKFVKHVLEALEIMNKEQQTQLLASEQEVDSQLYDGFIPDADKTVCRAIRASDASDISAFESKLKDSRLKALLPLYKARNYPESLSSEERAAWELFRTNRLLQGGASSRLQKYMNRLQELSQSKGLSLEKQYLLEELQLYAEAIMPVDQDY